MEVDLIMNCKPNEMAYIKIPEGEMPAVIADQLNGLVVMTRELIEAPSAYWVVCPHVCVVSPAHIRDATGRCVPPGKITFDGFPDAYLVPIRGQEFYDDAAIPKELVAG